MELPAGERAAFLQAATQDAEVTRLVLDLLEAENNEAERPGPGKSYGRFAVGQLLGRGGMGEVYSARDAELNREVAIKFLSAENVGSSGLVDRLIEEARAASGLNHPGIVTVYEVIRSEDSLAIVMELVHGVALRTRCSTPNPLAQVADWGSQIAEALAAAHGGGIVHRDVKPENVMLRPDGYVKVLDFGVAARMGTEDDLARIPTGTLGYMSPEQIEGKVLTGASDVFSLGVVLTELATGSHPFLKDTAELTATAIRSAPPDRAAGMQTAVPKPLGPLLQSMLAREPERRPSASMVASRLAAIAHQPAARTGRRIAAAPAAAALLLAAGLAAVFWFRQPQSAKEAADYQVRPLASLPGVERHPSISPDGTRVAFAFASSKDPTSHIYVKDLRDGTLTRITSAERSDYQPVFSPDATKLAFLRAANGRAMVMVSSSSGAAQRQVAEVGDLIREYSILAWDATGEDILVCDRPDEIAPEVAVFRISVATGARRQVTFPPPGMSDWMPAVTPDGTLGFARAAETGRGDLWSVP